MLGKPRRGASRFTSPCRRQKGWIRGSCDRLISCTRGSANTGVDACLVKGFVLPSSQWESPGRVEDVNLSTASASWIDHEMHDEYRRAPPVWAASVTVALDGLRYAVRSTSKAFVRSITKHLRLPVVDGRPDVVYSAVIPNRSAEAGEHLLYSGRRLVVRTLSIEVLEQALLEEFRATALESATDRVYLRVPTIRARGIGVLLPSRAANQIAQIERAAANAGIEITSSQALVLDLRNGRPVHHFQSPDRASGRAEIASADVIATPVGMNGFPSKEQVLFELAQMTLNLSSVGWEGLRALRALVERTDLIEWDETRPARALEPLLRGLERIPT